MDAVNSDIILDKLAKYWKITFNRPNSNNTLSRNTLIHLNQVLDDAQSNIDCSALVLQGSGGMFCTGLDFRELVNTQGSSIVSPSQTDYITTLQRLSTNNMATISLIDGKVVAGGVGIAVASDIIIATPDSSFSLPELLWGLIPACVLPYLMRRIGPQKALMLALTCETISADQAHQLGLVDIVSEKPEDDLRKLLMRLSLTNSQMIGTLKAFARSVETIDQEIENKATAEINKLINLPETQKKIRTYVETGVYPWVQKQ